MVDKTTKINYDVEDLHPAASGLQTSLFLIPSKESDTGEIEIYLWSHIGAGCPVPAYHGRWFSLGSPGTACEAESLVNALGEFEDTFREINAAYLGAEWDGNNHRGKWSADLDEYRIDELQIATQARDNCAQYWAACDWFQDSLSYIDLSTGTIAEIAAREAGAADDAVLAADDCEAWLENALSERRDELTEQAEGEDADKLTEDEAVELKRISELLEA